MSIFPFLNKSVDTYLGLVPTPVSCHRDESIQNVLKIFSENNIGCIVITCDQNKVVGIFTERDYIMKISQEESLDLSNRPVGDYMTENPFCIERDQKLGKVLNIMRLKKFRHLIIIDQNQHLLQVISIKDVLDWLNDIFEEYN